MLKARPEWTCSTFLHNITDGLDIIIFSCRTYKMEILFLLFSVHLQIKAWHHQNDGKIIISDAFYVKMLKCINYIFFVHAHLALMFFFSCYSTNIFYPSFAHESIFLSSFEEEKIFDVVGSEKKIFNRILKLFTKIN